MDVCTNGSTQNGTTACGYNNEGLYIQDCVSGAWVAYTTDCNCQEAGTLDQVNGCYFDRSTGGIIENVPNEGFAILGDRLYAIFPGSYEDQLLTIVNLDTLEIVANSASTEATVSQ